MNLLLDTHILLWALTDSGKLSAAAIDLLDDDENVIYYSIASIWETQIKHMLKPDKILLSARELSDMCHKAGYQLLQINERDIFSLQTLVRDESAPEHKDPFDRILLAQAKTESMRFVTHDSQIPYYHESCVLPV